MRVLETIRRSLLPTLAVGTLLVSAPLSAQPITPVTFEELGYNSQVNSNYLAGSQTNSNNYNCNWNGQTVQNGFSGFNWSGFGALDLQDYLYSDGQQAYGRCFVNGRQGSLYAIQNNQILTGYQQKYSGYNPNATQVVAVSGAQGPNGASFSSSSLFELKSMQLGGGWGNVANLRVTGLNNGNEVWSQDFNFLGIGGGFSSMMAKLGLINEVRFNATYSTALGTYDPYGSVDELRGYGDKRMNPDPYRTFWIDNINIQTSTVPEPSTWALMATGLAGLAFAARRRRKS
ncbi:PEP-CTERM sorting domain-containing protein [Gemmatimonas groenlandica]|uniref:PEP-CTERM sorting domain-containing protein n=1 Tax=Gemmatimonas groenlandica TaxID=2732249 RepID=A0A6M4ILM3_9BACT|nr:PEP-CTERM sorting domain-containing protein [Gemmatimonas groenlandica]QJR35914.1 PEP-CTERM sorting domain-containing protein [Gemmatimonas groenlandica]